MAKFQRKSGGIVAGGGGAPSGAAGGVLGGAYPDPSFAADMATQAELDAEAASRIAADSTLTANVQTASYVLVLADAGKVVTLNVASANTLTIPPNSSVAFPIGTVMEVFQYGAGQTTITPGAGVTLRSNGAKLKLSAQYAAASIRHRATDEWVVAGDVSA